MKNMNTDYLSKRKQEDDALSDAIGRDQTYEEFLKTDKTYLNEMDEAKKSTKIYSDNAFAK